MHFDFPPLPHNDFVQFSSPAKAWLEFQMPKYYKIMPAFPLAIAGVSLLVPHDPTLLHSCEIVVLGSALVFLIFFWLIVRRILPHLWPVLMLFIVINPYFMEFSLQTLMEMFILASFTVTLWACSRRTEWSALPAAWTSLTRYDSVFVVPLVGIFQYLKGGKKIRTLIITILAGTPFLIWLVLSVIHSPMVNPYVEEILDPTREFAFIPLVRMLVRMLIGRSPVAWPALTGGEIVLGLGVFVLALIGAVRLWKSNRITTGVMIGFIASYFLVHAIFRAANYRYNYPIIPYLGLLVFISLEPRNSAIRFAWSWRRAALFLLPGALLIWGTWGSILSGWVLAMWLFAIAWFTVLFGWKEAGSRKRRVIAFFIGLAGLLCLWPPLKIWDLSYFEQRGRFSELIAAYRWVKQNCSPDDRVLMVTPWYLEARYPRGELKNFVATDNLQSKDALGFIDECRIQDLDYVIWLSYAKDFGRVDYFHKETREYLLNEAQLGDPRSKPNFQLIRVLPGLTGQQALVYKFRPESSTRMQQDFLDFNREDNFRLLLSEGWCPSLDGHPGGRFLWAVGKASNFNLFLKNVKSGGSLNFVAFPLVGDKLPSQTIDVFVNDHWTGKVVLIPKEERYSVDLKGDFLLTGRNRFRFEYAFCARPIDLGTGPDVRELSVLFKKIYFLSNGNR